MAPHTKCAYYKCNLLKKGNDNISFFKFPGTDEKRCRQWQRNCGNSAVVNMSLDKVKHKLICEGHFDKYDIFKSGRRKLLRKNAVPIKSVLTDIVEQIDDHNNKLDSKSSTNETLMQTEQPSIKIEFESVDYDDPLILPSIKVGKYEDDAKEIAITTITDSPTTCVSNTNNANTIFLPIKEEYNEYNDDAPKEQEKTSTQTADSPKISKIVKGRKALAFNDQKHISALKKKLRLKKAYLERLQRKLEKQRLLFRKIVEEEMDKKSEATKTFIRLQLYHRKLTPWTISEKQLALSIYEKSPMVYEHMLNELKFTMPAVKTIKTWLDSMETDTE